ncbi:MAG: hypothetical protein M1827_003698 [Pycnora praestabilis]|nr:MAG: hypothetical protein M1827_003698 [Pycnora praestabilis]
MAPSKDGLTYSSPPVYYILPASFPTPCTDIPSSPSVPFEIACPQPPPPDYPARPSPVGPGPGTGESCSWPCPPTDSSPVASDYTHHPASVLGIPTTGRKTPSEAERDNPKPKPTLATLTATQARFLHFYSTYFTLPSLHIAVLYNRFFSTYARAEPSLIPFDPYPPSHTPTDSSLTSPAERNDDLNTARPDAYVALTGQDVERLREDMRWWYDVQRCFWLSGSEVWCKPESVFWPGLEYTEFWDFERWPGM